MSFAERLLCLSLCGAAGCTSPAAPLGRPAPTPESATRPVIIEGPASIAALRTALAAELPDDERERLSLRLAGLLRAAGRAGDRDADIEAAGVLRALVTRAPASLEHGDVAGLLASSLSITRAYAEALALARRTACPGVFSYQPGAVVDAPSDHSTKYWEAWERVHTEPIDLASDKSKKSFAAPPGGPRTFDEETAYKPLYAGCSGGTAAQWMTVAFHHLEADLSAGPFAMNRAAEALQHATAAGGPGARRARAQLGSVYAQREERARAVRELSLYLSECRRAPAGQREGCDRATREDAIRSLGQSLTYEDLRGTPDSAPYVPRLDAFDTVVKPEALRRALEVAAARLRDPALVSPDTGEVATIHAAVATTLSDLGQVGLAADVLERSEALFPLHPELPELLARKAELRHKQGMYQRPPHGGPDIRRSIEVWQAITPLTAEGSAWSKANAGDADARERAAALRARAPREIASLRLGLALSAARATATATPVRSISDVVAAFSAARDALAVAAAAGAEIDSAMLALELGLDELVARSRAGDDVPPSEWLRMGKLPVPASKEDSGDRASLFHVRVADAWVEHDERRWAATHGTEGVRPARFQHVAGTPLAPTKRVVPLPSSLSIAIVARRAQADALAAHGQRRAAARALQVAAELVLARGRLELAEPLLDEAVRLGCREPGGFEPFLLRVDVARAKRDTASLHMLATLHAGADTTCASTPDERVKGARLLGAR